MQLGEVGVDEV